MSTDWPDPPEGYVIDFAPDGTYTSRRVGPEPVLTWPQLRAFIDFALSCIERRKGLSSDPLRPTTTTDCIAR